MPLSYGSLRYTYYSAGTKEGVCKFPVFPVKTKCLQFYRLKVIILTNLKTLKTPDLTDRSIIPSLPASVRLSENFQSYTILSPYPTCVNE